MKYRIAGLASAVVLVAAMGCVEQSSSDLPTSDGGHLYLDLEESLAVDWQAEIRVLGPTAGGEHCDEQRGCYPAHEPVDMEDVTSADSEIVEVVDFEPDTYGETDAIRVDLEVHEEGETELEFSFVAEVEASADDEGDEGGDSETGETDDLSDELVEEVVTDTFGVESREVSSVRLSRSLDDVDPDGPYGHCPERGAGTYLMGSLQDYTVELELAKLDAQGNRLRGLGRFPFEVEPEDAIEVDEEDGANHRVVIRPTQFGSVTLTPEIGGTNFVTHFVDIADLNQLEMTAYQLTDQGTRGGVAQTMYVDHLYEIDAMAPLPDDAPLCGGMIPTELDVLTPAICDQIGITESTGNPVVAAQHGGQCQLRVSGHETNARQLVAEQTFNVEYNW